MIFHMASRVLTLSLLTTFATQAAGTSMVETAETLKDLSILTTISSLNKALETFGGTFQQAVALYKENSDELRALNKLPAMVSELKNQIDHLETQRNSTSLQTTELLRENADLRSQLEAKTGKVPENKWEAIVDSLAEQLTIKNMVEDYNKTKNWPVLKESLGSVLDHDSPAYDQLQNISLREQYAPWEIAYRGYAELVSVLVFAGRGLDMTDGSDDNLLHGAVAGGQVSLVNMLLDNGADIELGNGWGNRPLALACKYRRLDVARLLWKRGADVDGINYDEKWAGLARAVDNGDLDIVKFMVEEAHASTTIKDRDGRTPLELAQYKGHTAVAEYLSKFPQ